MQSTIREHRDGGNAGGIFNRYNVIRVSFLSFRVKIGLQSSPENHILTRKKIFKVIILDSMVISHLLPFSQMSPSSLQYNIFTSKPYFIRNRDTQETPPKLQTEG